VTSTIVVAALILVAVAGLGGYMTDVGPWYRALKKPTWQPPDWLFAPAWTIILGCATWAGVVAWEAAADSAAQVRVAALFAVNGVFYSLWSPLFFRFRRPDWALVEVVFFWLSVLALTVGLAPISQTASWLLAPYLAWVTFAAYLNLTIVRLNPSFGAAQPSASA
jgi:tryptophan-rich sensory protein